MKTAHLGKQISLLYRYSQIYFNAALKEYQLGSGQYIFLISLIKEDGINQEELAHRVCIDKDSTARAVAKLEHEGYIRREVSAVDRRAYTLYATEKAKRVYQALNRIFDEWNARLLAGFSDEEKTDFQAFLSRAVENVLRG